MWPGRMGEYHDGPVRRPECYEFNSAKPWMGKGRKPIPLSESSYLEGTA